MDKDEHPIPPDIDGDWVWYSISLVVMFFLVVSCVYITWMENN